jgi:hypothetical protein
MVPAVTASTPGTQNGRREVSLAPALFSLGSQPRWISAAISLSFDSYSRAWWPQKSSSPPLERMARTCAAAPHRSQRSAAVNSGRVSVGDVIGVSLRPGIGCPMPSIQRRPLRPCGCPSAPRCSLASTLADAQRLASVPGCVGCVSRRITPDVVDQSRHSGQRTPSEPRFAWSGPVWRSGNRLVRSHVKRPRGQACSFSAEFPGAVRSEIVISPCAKPSPARGT